MKIQKAELAQKLNKIKGVVPKKTSIPALQGILVTDGYLIANNTEMTVKAKIEGPEGESFIIPERAFDLINNLPDGEIDISVEAGNIITIKADGIKNRYQTMDASLFPEPTVQEEGNDATIDAGMLLGSMRRVSYAVSEYASNSKLTAMCLQAADGYLNFVGSDGHVLAWDRVEYDGEFELLVPKSAVERMKALGLSGDVRIRHSKTGAVFTTQEFEVCTRLIDGEYFNYQKMFDELPMRTAVSRTKFLDAAIRAKMCAVERVPVRFDLEGSTMNLSIKDKVTDYHEKVDLQKTMEGKLTIGFNVRLVLETIRSFDCSNVEISFGSPQRPMMVAAEDSGFKALVLPVALR